MIEGLKEYPVYRAAGLPWLDKVPANWKILRGKNVFRVVDIRSTTGEEELLTVSSNVGVIPRSQHSVTMFKAESYVGHKLVWSGDLVVNSLWAWMQGLGFSSHHGLVSSAYSVYRPSSGFAAYAKYLHEILRSSSYKWELMTRSKGVWLSRLQLSDAAFMDMPILIPPPEEQEAIVRFLDHADRRIRRYIAAKQRLIKLLEEQKQAIIQRAVTRGLDSDVRLKPSGVEWLGDIPEHWEVLPLKRLSTIQSGVTLGKRYASTDELLSYSYLRVANVQAGRLDLRTIKTVLVPKQEAHRSLLRDGDLLMTEGGDPDKLGRGCLWRSEVDPCLHQNHVFAVRSNQLLEPAYLEAVTGSSYSRDYFLRTSKQTTNLASTNSTTIGEFRIAIPGRPEQRNILRWLGVELRDVAKALERVALEINLLREYRIRLIADVVTGKLDVRGVDLPELPYDDSVADVDVEDAESDDLSDEVDEEEEALAL